MKITTYISVSMIFMGLGLTGCVTTHETKGFQTNPSFKTSKGFPHSFAKEKETNGIQKFFSSLVGGNKKSNKLDVIPVNQEGIPLDNDATSLHSKGTLSPELLNSLGRMGLNKGRYDAAAGYFERALQMDPKNEEATAGLAEAEAKRGNLQKSQEIYEAIRRQPNGNLINPLGQKKNDTGIQLVAYDEEEDESEAISPEEISLEPVEIPKAPEMIMQPEIKFGRPQKQRVANPFFGTTRSLDPAKVAGTRIVKETKPNKLQIVQPASRKTSLKLSDN